MTFCRAEPELCLLVAVHLFPQNPFDLEILSLLPSVPSFTTHREQVYNQVYRYSNSISEAALGFKPLAMLNCYALFDSISNKSSSKGFLTLFISEGFRAEVFLVSKLFLNDRGNNIGKARMASHAREHIS